MPPHFTYLEKCSPTTLCQGDILSKTPALMEVLRRWHPYFFENEDYKYFFVLTQSCDLFRRNEEKCNSKYITISAVRTLTDVLERRLSKLNIQHIGELWLIDEKDKIRVEQFLQRLLNNNESEFFYLSNDTTLDFPEPMVATLAVSVALKAEEHYKTCLDAKKMELDNAFKAKLGWLLGQLYSRVGTPDWETENRKGEYEARILEIIETNFKSATKARISAVMSEIEKLNLPDDDIESLVKVYDSCPFVTAQDKFEKIVSDICRSNMGLFSNRDSSNIFLTKVMNSQQIKYLLKPD